jgi:hypothetical protein
MAHSRKISRAFVSINNVLDKNIKLEVMNRPEMQIQTTQSRRFERNPSLATNTLMATAGLISQTFL